MGTIGYDRSVFVNCPFDNDYAPILQAICCCLLCLDLVPRLSSEAADTSSSRLERIVDLIDSSRFGIHDLSRLKPTTAEDWCRLNMPFELGLDFAAMRFAKVKHGEKVLLVLAQTPYDHQKALSDFAGRDVKAHNADYGEAVAIVRDWVAKSHGTDIPGAAKLLSQYHDFQVWHYGREASLGSSHKDVTKYETSHVVRAMQDWLSAGKPTRFTAAGA